MKVLFIHQDFPGQFGHLAAFCAASSKNEVLFITKCYPGKIRGVGKIIYSLPSYSVKGTHSYARLFDRAVRYGNAAAKAAMTAKRKGYYPDVIVAHPGWGETLYIKDIFPSSPLLIYCEFYFSPYGPDIDFDPEYPATSEQRCQVRSQNAIDLLSLDSCDGAVSPTVWQQSQFPTAYRHKISVVHDGIDTSVASPCSDVTIKLSTGVSLSQQDEIVTYVSRNLEPYRGFHIFMRAVTEICRRRAKTQFLIIGGNGVSYSQPLLRGRSYKDKVLSETPIDHSRVHFLGRLPYKDYIRVLQISSVHIYLTYPFVLSWSLLEAMSAGCLIIGSATPPVKEVIENGKNGLLVDFFSPLEIADRVDDVFSHKNRFSDLRKAARATVLSRYDLHKICLPQQMELLQLIATSKE